MEYFVIGLAFALVATSLVCYSWMHTTALRYGSANKDFRDRLEALENKPSASKEDLQALRNEFAEVKIARSFGR